MKKFLGFLIVSLFATQNYAQEISVRDSLLAGWHFEHMNYNVTHYALRLKIDVDLQEISGNTTVSYTVVEDNHEIQLDLIAQLAIDSVLFENQKCTFRRLHDSFFVKLPRETLKGEKLQLTAFYHGKPPIAKNAPWEGGFVFEKDKSGNPFVGVACQEIGAYSWWANKALLVDKCDSADMYFEVPSDLQAISNGQFISKTDLGKTAIFHWKVTYPINNYNISVTIGKFAHFTDRYNYGKTSYDLSYYVLPENLKKAKKQFKQVKPMLKIYEELFGAYPFARDGFKLIETPYVGMEHQSGIAYGNHYQNGYNGTFFTKINKKFDFIIIHETGHEYWGNNVTMDDLSEMWIQEAFCTYTELLYIEKRFGKKYTNDYVNYWKSMVKNDEPLVNKRFSNQVPTTDIYYKGALLIHTLRNKVNDDKLFFKLLKEFQEKYVYQNVDKWDFIFLFEAQTKLDMRDIFDMYLHEK